MVNLANALDDFDPGKKRPETFAVGHMQLCAAAELTREFVKSRLEIIFAEEDAR